VGSFTGPQNSFPKERGIELWAAENIRIFAIIFKVSDLLPDCSLIQMVSIDP